MSQLPSSEGVSGMQNGRGARMTARVILWVALLVVIIYAVVAYLHKLSAEANQINSTESAVRSTGLIEPAEKHLAPQFVDSQSRLLADPPAAAKQVDPQVIVVGHVTASDPETPAIAWPQFVSYLQQAMGRKVQEKIFDTVSAEITGIKDGSVTVVATHAADAPFLVNNFGYQPVAVLAEGQGVSGNHLDLLVAANSSITRPADVKGQSLVCTVPSSITGYRAAIVLLMENERLRPEADYFLLWSTGQKRSINGVIKGEYPVAAISDDKLKSMAKKGSIKPSQYKILYQSDVIPRTTIGYFYNLKPEVADKLRQAIVSFTPQNTAASSADGDSADVDTAGSSLHFVATDYKRDFKLVRDIDDRFDPRLDTKKPKEK